MVVTKENSLKIKGLSMLMVILHHCSQIEPFGIFNILFSNLGYLACGLFFFLSGYGLSLSFPKHNSDKQYLIKKILSLLKIYTISWGGYLVVFLYYKKYLSTSLISDFFTLGFPNGDAWFFKEIIFFYIFYWLLCRYISKETLRHKILFSSILLLIIILYLMKFPEYWYNSMICFPLGTLYTSKRFLSMSMKRVHVLVTIFFGVSLFVIKVIYHVYPNFLSIIIAITFVIIVIKYHGFIKSNIFLKYVGINSLSYYTLEDVGMKYIDYPHPILPVYFFIVIIITTFFVKLTELVNNTSQQ